MTGKLYIYISTFGKKTMKVKNGIPIEVGAASRNNFLYSLHDDTGDNISKENANYADLTGLYWIWKNINFKSDDLVGFCQYHLGLDISNRKITQFFSRAEKENTEAWITLEPIKIRRHDAQDEMDALSSVLREHYPAYYNKWCEFYHKDGSARGEFCRGGNVFITTAAQMNRYCTFLFDVLKKVRKIIGDKLESPTTERRYCSFMGERLLSVYVATNNYMVLDTKVRYKPRYLRKARYIINKFHINRDTKLYKWLRDRFGYKSSFGRKI